MKELENTNQTFKPEFIRISAAIKIFGIGRTKLYELISKGKIKSVNMKSRGAIRGTRLISYDSLLDFLNSQAEGGNTNQNQEN